ncbi:DUF4391 domain-containing protein [Evansella tamaricis]|uniref:DUF4391 domain-containing protein n=1 Tax=Evansella tamaricis TaxID=2069301 RepID=A0ABS6JED0_9BACI|nr:DUF4391 domain-containing protein [Evansella tamaricis]MBU9712036.1 DUF4391 domain-containing protein [Evansella tamaricis]
MLTFPESTLFNRRIPKSKFYHHLSVSHQLEQKFTQEVDTIVWKNKFSPETINIEKGKEVSEIQVMEVNLKNKSISDVIIETIDRDIPYHLLFLLRYQDFAQLRISYKEYSKNREGKFKVDSYFQTEWMLLDQLFLAIEGINLDKVYENFIIQIAGDQLQTKEDTDIKTSIDISKEVEKLKKDIQMMEKKMKQEKQFNRQVKLSGEIRKLKKELERKLK